MLLSGQDLQHVPHGGLSQIDTSRRRRARRKSPPKATIGSRVTKHWAGHRGVASVLHADASRQAANGLRVASCSFPRLMETIRS